MVSATHPLSPPTLKRKAKYACFHSMAGWWIFLAQMLASVDFPVQIPVFDISHIIKPASAKLKEKDEQYNA